MLEGEEVLNGILPVGVVSIGHTSTRYCPTVIGKEYDRARFDADNATGLPDGGNDGRHASTDCG